VLGPLDEHEVAVTRATDAFVADRFAGNLHWPERRGFEGGRVRATLTLQSMRRVGKSTGHTLGIARLSGRGGLRADGGSDRSRRVISAERDGLSGGPEPSAGRRAQERLGWLSRLSSQESGSRGCMRPRLGDHGDATRCIHIGGCPYTTV